MRNQNAVRDQSKLSPKQRLALVVDTSFPTASILSMEDADIDSAFLRKHCPAANIKASGLNPLSLRQRGVHHAEGLVALGFDSLHLVDSVFCEAAIAAFGAPSVVEAFITTSVDAVAVAGTGVVHSLGLTQDTLLRLCAGSSIEALAVISQTPSNPLRGVTMDTLLDTGLRSKQLESAGINDISELMGTPLQKVKLGY